MILYIAVVLEVCFGDPQWFVMYNQLLCDENIVILDIL